MFRLTFYGAAGTVTGSKYLVEVDDKKILIDCGMFQGAKELRQRNWKSLPIDVSTIDAIVITHGHIDHIGYLPRLVREGFKGTIYMTGPTVDISGLSLLDTAELQMEDAEFRNKRKISSHDIALPLFTTDDVEEAKKHFKRVDFGTWIPINNHFRFRYLIAGHILGAASVELILDDGSNKKTIFFSGDVGRYGNPLTVDPARPVECDYLVCESTYGGKIHPAEDPHSILADIINEVVKNKSILLIPAFAVGRTQQLVYMINHLIERKFIPPIDVHIDSPMAVSATEVYLKYPTFHSIDLSKLHGENNVLDGKYVHFHRDKKSSQELQNLKGPAIIISSSGMLTGGRIMHHLIQRLPDPTTTVALVGFMADGTLGRQIQDGQKTVFIHKMAIEVNAKVVQMSGLSGHADYFELLHWLEPWKTAPKKVFVTHGEPAMSQAMAQHLKEERGWDSLLPELDQSVEL